VEQRMNGFNQVKEQYLDKLTVFIPIVDRVHGKTHPEFREVRQIFNEIIAKTTPNRTDLENEFKRLREITNNYIVPKDVCESYEAVYNMLAELDKAYQA
jgi:iron-sulfur cluster repair protein YtfE (RIC family)